MNFKGVLLALVGVFLVYIAVKGTYKDVWKSLTAKKSSGGNAGNSAGK